MSGEKIHSSDPKFCSLSRNNRERYRHSPGCSPRYTDRRHGRVLSENHPMLEIAAQPACCQGVLPPLEQTVRSPNRCFQNQTMNDNSCWEEEVGSSAETF